MIHKFLSLLQIWLLVPVFFFIITIYRIYQIN